MIETILAKYGFLALSGGFIAVLFIWFIVHNISKSDTEISVLGLVKYTKNSPDMTVSYKTDEFGVPVPVVNGVPYPLTEEEKTRIIQSIVDVYCPRD